MKELLTRNITALFLAAGAYGLIRYVPLTYFSIIVLAVALGAAAELARLAQPGQFSRTLLIFNGLVVGSSFTFGKPAPMEMVILVLLTTGLFFLLFTRKTHQLETFIRDIGVHFLVMFYVVVPLYFLFELKALHPNYLFFLIFVVAIGDSGAYFIGRPFGKHKIYPVASPNKSLEGLIAAIVFAAGTGWLSLRVFPLPVDDVTAMVTAGVIGLLSQLSDPVESLFKRAAGKKDSGSLLPGHGGILDRVDSYIFCAPVLFYAVRYLWN